MRGARSARKSAKPADAFAAKNKQESSCHAALCVMDDSAMNPQLLSYYEAIERASADMLNAARAGNWDEVVKLEGACVLLISQLKNAARQEELKPDEARAKSRIMQRILVNDAEIRHLAEPWLHELDEALAGRRRTLH
jgi:flagellar protein FliT